MNILNKFEIKKMAETREFYECKNLNNKKEKLIIEITECYYDNADKNSLSNLWVKNGYTKKLYDNSLMVQCYCYEENGNCCERYNPTEKLSEDGKRNIINFDWLLKVSNENKLKLINEIYKRFMGTE